ncbi:MAG: hypothetical protein HYX75_20170 [Acidobacteria bacterium]|nr:hypothetical protein [Acidobacteriota bacterium]
MTRKLAGALAATVVLLAAALPGPEIGMGTHVTFAVDARRVAGTLRALNGVQGGPRPTIGEDPDLAARYREAGIPVVRLPQDDGFINGDSFGPDYRLTLGDIFPNRQADVEDPDSYHFEDIDAFIRRIRAAGATPLWTLCYDIGAGANAYASNGNQAGRAPMDSDRWADVIVHVLRHFNDGWGTDGHRWNVRYVELPNEPCTLGGFDCGSRESRQELYDAWATLVRKIRDYNAVYRHSVKVAAPGLPAHQAIRWLPEFLANVRDQDLPLDIYSYHDYAWPDEILDRARTIRETLDAGGYEAVPVWNTEWNWPLYKPAPDEVLLDDAGQSAYVAAHNAQVKTLLQDLWDEAFVYRATRSARRAQRPNPGEFFYFHLDGEKSDVAVGAPKPAYYEWVIYDQMASATPQRLVVNRPVTSPTLLAARSPTGTQLRLLVVHWCRIDTPERAAPFSYRMRISGLSQGRLTATLYAVDATTTRLQPIEDRIVIVPPDGVTTLKGTMNLWSLHYWKLHRQ